MFDVEISYFAFAARRWPFTMTARLLLIDDDARLSEMVGDFLRGFALPPHTRLA